MPRSSQEDLGVKVLQVGVLAVALSAGSAMAQRVDSDIKVIAAKQTSGDRLLLEESTPLPEGVTAYRVSVDSKRGTKITTPLSVTRVPDGTLPAARPLPEGLRKQVERIASRRRDSERTMAVDYPERCGPGCSFVLWITYDSGAESYFVFARYPSSVDEMDTDEVSTIVRYEHEYVEGVVFSHTEAGWLPTFDVESCVPDACEQSCIRPAADESCTSVLWGAKYRPSSLSGTVVMSSEGRVRPCRLTQPGCETIFDGTEIGVTLYPY